MGWPCLLRGTGYQDLRAVLSAASSSCGLGEPCWRGKKSVKSIVPISAQPLRFCLFGSWTWVFLGSSVVGLAGSPRCRGVAQGRKAHTHAWWDGDTSCVSPEGRTFHLPFLVLVVEVRVSLDWI
jgi:hypothetical protein